MNDEERNAMREHIVWLTKELEDTRDKLKARDSLLGEMLNPDALGHAVSNEVRGLIYTMLYLTDKE